MKRLQKRLDGLRKDIVKSLSMVGKDIDMKHFDTYDDVLNVIKDNMTQLVNDNVITVNVLEECVPLFNLTFNNIFIDDGVHYVNENNTDIFVLSGLCVVSGCENRVNCYGNSTVNVIGYSNTISAHHSSTCNVGHKNIVRIGDKNRVSHVSGDIRESNVIVVNNMSENLSFSSCLIRIEKSSRFTLNSCETVSLLGCSDFRINGQTTNLRIENSNGTMFECSGEAFITDKSTVTLEECRMMAVTISDKSTAFFDYCFGCTINCLKDSFVKMYTVQESTINLNDNAICEHNLKMGNICEKMENTINVHDNSVLIDNSESHKVCHDNGIVVWNRSRNVIWRSGITDSSAPVF